MKLSFSKIIFFLTILCSVAFAGGIEEDSGPEEISETQELEVTNSETNLTTREDISEFQDLSENPGGNCIVNWGNNEYVNDPNFTDNLYYATWC
jgi:hypothetical protein